MDRIEATEEALRGVAAILRGDHAAAESLAVQLAAQLIAEDRAQRRLASTGSLPRPDNGR